MTTDIPESLRVARRQLVTIPEFQLLNDLTWNASVRKWELHFEIKCSDYKPSEFVPQDTRWFALISPSYPIGDISIYPDKTGGITGTFKHQLRNTPSANHAWREGKICVDTSTNSWGRKELKEQPEDAETRLWWHVHRALDWVKAAANDMLAIPGEPFELPHIPLNNSDLLVFHEDEYTLQEWKSCPEIIGLFSFKAVNGIQQAYMVECFTSSNWKLSYKWGKKIIESNNTPIEGVWVMVPEIPVLAPWELPTTWGQLFDMAHVSKIDLKKLLIDTVRKYARRNLKMVAIGFPIAETVGSAPVRIHWFFASLPDIPLSNGFRNESSKNLQRATMWFSNGVAIKWSAGENWSKDQITSRGRILEHIQKSSILLVGGGSAGSQMSDLLVRLGCEQILIVDPQVMTIGNLSRHTLTMSAIRVNKARMMAYQLNSIFPFSKVEYCEKSLEEAMAGNLIDFHKFDMVIDLTGEDDVIHLLSTQLSGTNKTFISLSIGLLAKRLYCFIARPGENDDIQKTFHETLSPWLIKDRDENAGLVLPREGIGCWHPVFPARLDDIAMLINSVVRPLERVLGGEKNSSLIVAEKVKDDDGNPAGLTIKYL